MKFRKAVSETSSSDVSEIQFVRSKTGGMEIVARRINGGGILKKTPVMTPDEFALLAATKMDKDGSKVLTDVNFTEALNSKLTGIATGATANSSDAQIRDRSSHTETQAISTVTGLQAAIDSALGSMSGRFTANAAELSQAQNDKPDQTAVFNSWYRFSHNTTGVFPANENETTTWSINATTGLIRNTTNSATLIGVVSLETYEDYDLTVRVYSTDNDDDTIAITAAFYKDPVTGAEHTITVARSPGGNSGMWRLMYNFAQGSPREKILEDGNRKVTWGNNASGTLSRADSGYVNNNPGWGNMGAFQGTDGSVLIRVKRTGNLIEAWTSHWATPSMLDEATKLSVDLTSNPALGVFVGGSSYGFSSFSQAWSHWDVITFTNPKDAIFDIAEKKTYVHNGTTWIQSTDITFDSLPKNAILSNPETKKLFLNTHDGVIIQLKSM